MTIQAEMSERALELLGLPDEPCFVLDIGCGSGNLSIYLSIYMYPALYLTLGVAQVIYLSIYVYEPCYVLDIGCGSGNLSIYLCI